MAFDRLTDIDVHRSESVISFDRSKPTKHKAANYHTPHSRVNEHLRKWFDFSVTNDNSGMVSGYTTLRTELQALVLGVGTSPSIPFIGYTNQSFFVANVDALASAPQANALVNSVQTAICAWPLPTVRPPCTNYVDIVVILHSYDSQLDWNKVIIHFFCRKDEIR